MPHTCKRINNSVTGTSLGFIDTATGPALLLQVSALLYCLEYGLFFKPAIITLRPLWSKCLHTEPATIDRKEAQAIIRRFRIL